MQLHPQLLEYIQRRRAIGIADATIQTELTNAGWPTQDITVGLRAVPSIAQTEAPLVPAPAQPTDPKKVLKAILWMVSPFVLLFGAAFISFIAQFTLGSEGGLAIALNIITLLMGVIGVLMVFIGPVIGIVILARKS